MCLCNENSVSQQEIVSLYQRFCQLDRNSKGFISADEFLSVPEFATNPLSQVLFQGFLLYIYIYIFFEELMVGNIYDLLCCGVWNLSIIWYSGVLQRLLKMVDGLNFKDFVAFLSVFSAKASVEQKIECKCQYSV